ncbi:MAG TPA: hypothetical protein VHW46_13270 [Terracidiphilus sp.]|jgi:hypothetical protein|nr:hypothetical protein [Terracidiphilus sp.]
MTGQDLQEIQETRASVLLRCEQLQAYLETTKVRLNQAAGQLEELTKILLTQSAASRELLSRPWLKELAIGQLVDDVLEAEKKLTEVRTVAAELGIPLLADQR